MAYEAQALKIQQVLDDLRSVITNLQNGDENVPELTTVQLKAAWADIKWAQEELTKVKWS